MRVADTVRAILFDLDDTLLGNDMDRFLKAYFGLLAPHVAAYVPPEKFIPALLAATRTMVENTDPGVTNQQAFVADFFPRIGLTMDELMPVFDDFYATQFGKLRSHTRCLPAARSIVQAAFGAGYDVVIATNPLFPETAIRQRLAWAGVAEFPFKLVTSYETMHFSKPHTEYYLEIAGRIGRQPGECVMVGDDRENDIAPAMRAGLRVYWINTNADLLPESDSCARGTLADFGRWLTEGMLDAL